MKPEELFKIENTEIPEIEKDFESSSENNVIKEKKIDVFDKNLNIDDLINFLKENNISNDLKTIEKHYEQIISNNKEKESITEVIKELDREKEILTTQIEKEPNNQIVLKKIQDLDDKISNLNTEERIKEDNVKNIVKEIFQTNTQEIKTIQTEKSFLIEPQTTNISEFKAEKVATNQGSEISSEKIGLNLESKISPEKIALNGESEIRPENIALNGGSEITPENIASNLSSKINQEIGKKENIDQTNSDKIKIEENIENIKIENDREDINPLEKINPNPLNDEKEFFKNIDKNETLEEVKKNAQMLKEISQNINHNFELMLKVLYEKSGENNNEVNNDLKDIEPPKYVDSPKISQPKYISEYRKSLRKYGGMESFLGHDAPFKGDNLGSYV